MSLRQSRSPYGYKDLLVYKKAEELQRACAEFTAQMLEEVRKGERGKKGEMGEAGEKGWKTIAALQDQMDRSARSVKQNIVEGWKRNSTKEYYDFLGFSMGANAELEEDCDDIIKGIYKGVKWDEGEVGGKGIKGERGKNKWTIGEVEKLRFYPLDATLPPVIQLKLRCKEINFLLHKLQESLSGKMQSDHTLSRQDVLVKRQKSERADDRWYEETLEKQGLVRLPDGRIVPKEEKGGKGGKGNKG